MKLYFSIAAILAAFFISNSSFAACPTTSIAVKDATGATQTLCYAGGAGAYLNQTMLTDSSNAAISATNGLYNNLLQSNAILSATNGIYTNILQGNAVISATNGIFDNLLQGNAVLSATNGIYTNILQGNAVLATTNPIYITGTGTAGSAATNPITVQGIASMTPILSNPGTASSWGVQTVGSTTSGQSGVVTMAATTTNPPSNTTAQTNMLSQDLNGNLRTAAISPCNKVINISQTTTTDLHTFTGFGYICGGVIVTSAAMNVGIDEGTGTTCETSGTALIGVSSTASATATIALATNGGFIIPSFRTQTSADHLCLISGTGTVAGTITYADLTN